MSNHLVIVLLVYLSILLSMIYYLYKKLMIMCRIVDEKSNLQIETIKKLKNIGYKKDIGLNFCANEVCKILHSETGINIKLRQKSVIKGALKNRLNKVGLTSYSDYLNLLSRGDQNERSYLIDLFTTSYTFFYRETEQINALIEQLPELLKKLKKNGEETLNIWSAACSQGHEVYTLCIMLNEAIEKFSVDIKLKIIGTDIDLKSINKAKKGIYTAKEVESVPEYLREKYFDKGQGKAKGFYKINSFTRKMCFFELHNLKNTYKSDLVFDAIFLRNVIIYFDQDLIKKVINNVSKNLKNNGCIITGLSEPLIENEYVDLSRVGHSFYRYTGDSPVLKYLPSNLFSKKSAYACLSSEKINTLFNKFCSQKMNQQAHILKDIFEINRKAKDVELLILDIDECSFYRKVVKSCIFKLGIDIILITNKDLNDDPDFFEVLQLGVIDYIKKNKDGMIPELRLEKVISKYESKNKISKKVEDYNLNVPIFIGASTGGIRALTQLFKQFPLKIPPVVVVQHIPGKYSSDFTSRLNQLLPFEVKEGEDGDELKLNRVIIAPSGQHLRIVKVGTKYKIKLKHEQKVSGFMPSVDVMFESVAKNIKGDKIGLLLTGMGKDGAAGLLKMRQTGAVTVAQGENSSVVYGMPKEALKIGAVDTVIDLGEIASSLSRLGATLNNKKKVS